MVEFLLSGNEITAEMTMEGDGACPPDCPCAQVTMKRITFNGYRIWGVPGGGG